MHLDAVVGVAVGELTGIQLHERGEDVGHAGCGTRRCGQVDVAGRLVQQAAGPVGAGAHPVEDVAHGDELVDRMAELLACGGIGLGLAAGGFAQSDGLGADTQAGAVHQRHHVFDQAQTTLTHDLAGRIGELQLSGRRTLDAHLVLDAAHHHAAVRAVEHEIRQAAAVVRSFLAAGKHQVQVRVAVGDEALHPVQAPATGRLVVRSLETDRLQVAAGVRFGKVHRTGRTLADTGQILVFQRVAAEFLDGVGTVGQAPDGGETHVGAGNHLGHHHNDGTRKIETIVLALQRHAVEARLDQHVEVPAGAGRIADTASFERRTLVVHRFGVGRDDVSCDFTEQVHDQVILLHGFFGGSGRFGMPAGLGKVFFLYGNDLFHLGMTEIER